MVAPVTPEVRKHGDVTVISFGPQFESLDEFTLDQIRDFVLEAAHLDAVGEKIKALRRDDELAEAEIAVEGDVRLAAAREPGEVGLQAEQRGVGLLLAEERADLGEFDFEFSVHGKGIAAGFRLPI